MRLYTRATAADAWIRRFARTDGVTIADAVNERSTATAIILDNTGLLMLDQGVGVLITLGDPLTSETTEVTADATGYTADYAFSPDDETVIFQGFIDKATERRVGVGGTREITIECADLHYLADKRVIVDAFTDTSAGDIVRALITSTLAAEGVTEGNVQDGPTVRAITFNYARASDALMDLAERAGYWWRINPDGTLDFADPLAFLTIWAGSESVNAGAESEQAGAIGGSDLPTLNVPAAALADTVNVARHSHGYRNRQWIRGGRSVTAPQTEVQFGDGEQRAFVLGFDIAAEPTISVSRAGGPFTAETVGEGGTQEGNQWSYRTGSNSVSQASTGTVLGEADRVRVVYTGFFDVVARVDDAPKQLARASVEGGSGIIESVLQDRTSTSADAAFQLAGELLSYWARPSVVVRFATRDSTFRPGQALAVSLPEAGLSSMGALVATVESFSVARDDRFIVTLVAGPIEGSWAQWFGALSRRIDKFADIAGGELEIVTILAQFEKDWTEVETPNIFRETRAGTATASASTFPEFAIPDRVKYLAWIRDGSEIGRKEFTTQTGASSDEIVTTTVVTAGEAVGSITEFAWFGGIQATSAIGSGLELDRQAYVRLKTDIEQLQVEKTDRKWGS